MQSRFVLTISPDEAVVRELAEREPENLFITPAFMRGLKLRGFTPCLLALMEAGKITHACLGAWKTGRLSSSLDIRLLPDLPKTSPFWKGLQLACKRLGAWDLTIYAVTSKADPIPSLGPVSFSESGLEYHLPLGSDPVPLPVSSNLRRNLSKAKKSGLVLQRTSSPAAVPFHMGLMASSQERRRERGEDIAGKAQHKYYEEMLAAGAGEFFQAVDASGTALSSVFFLRSKAAAYYQSAGTSAEGMSLGASAFLIWNAAETLRREGVTKFCLGGSTLENTGLVRFKSGFGGVEVPFYSRTFTVVSPLKRKVRTFLHMVRRDPREVLKGILLIDRYPVFAREAAAVPKAEARPELTLVKLDNDRLRQLCAAYPEFHRQAERLDELPYNDAWGVLMGDELVHVSWMVTPEHDRVTSERNLKLREGEVEITHCHTAEAHRGKGIYPHVIRELSHQAAKQGFKRVLMITHHTNTASQQGMIKAGLKQAGMVSQLRSPFVSESPLAIWRGHR